MSATTKKLDFADVPPRASSSRSLRTEVVPSNGQSFTMGQTIILDIPSNVSNTFWDAQSSYVRLNFKNADADPINFESGGFPAAIRRIELLQGGTTMCSIENYGVLYQMMIDLDTSGQFRANAGEVLFGAGSTGLGKSVASNATRQVCFPLALTPIFQAAKYWPLFGLEPLRLRIEVNSAKAGLIAADDDMTDASGQISEVALVMYQLQLGQDVMNQVIANSGGMMRIAMPCFQHHQASLAQNATSLATTLGFSMSSLNRVLVATRKSAVTGNASTIGNRSRLGLSEANLKIGGVQYPQIKIKDRTGDGSEVLAEALVSQRALLSYSHDSTINIGAGFADNDPAGSNDDTIGHFLVEIDLESQRVDAGSLVAGVNCTGQVVQFEANYTNVASPQVVDIFGEYTIMAQLDLNTLTWQIAV